MGVGKSPSFQFYPADFLADVNVVLMSMAERGAYITLLSHAWVEGRIPIDLSDIRRILGGDTDTQLGRVLGCFRKNGTHKRLDIERARQKAWREKSKAGADKRWGGTTTPMPGRHTGGNALQSSSSSSSSSIGKTKTPPRSARAPADPKPAEILKRIWNEHRGPLAECLAMSPKRAAAASARWNAAPDEARWTAAVKRLARSSFAAGNGDRGWHASFDYLVKPDVLLKIEEGQYDDGPGAKLGPAGRTPVREDEHAEQYRQLEAEAEKR